MLRIIKPFCYLYTKVIGRRRALSLGRKHEKGNYKGYKKRKLEDGEIQDKISSEMDLYNNEVGIEIGVRSETLDLENLIVKAILEGRCKIIKRDENGNFLDCDGHIIPKENLKGKWENDKCLVWSNS